MSLEVKKRIEKYMNAGTIGYLLMIFGIILSFFREKLISLFLLGGILVSYNWIMLGEKKKDMVMKINGSLFFIFPVITIFVTFVAVLMQSIAVIKYYLLSVFAFGFVGVSINIFSHYRAFKKTKVSYFKFSAIVRVICFSIMGLSSIPLIKEILALNSFLQLPMLLTGEQTKIFLLGSLIYIFACSLSAKGFADAE